MKRCPTCNLVETDDALRFCRADGTTLINYSGPTGAEAKRVLGELKEISKRRHVSPHNMAVVYTGLNDKDQAFEWLDRAYEARSFGMTQLKVETVMDNLRSDPRFRELLKRLGLPE